MEENIQSKLQKILDQTWHPEDRTTIENAIEYIDELEGALNLFLPFIEEHEQEFLNRLDFYAREVYQAFKEGAEYQGDGW